MCPWNKSKLCLALKVCWPGLWHGIWAAWVLIKGKRSPNMGEQITENVGNVENFGVFPSSARSQFAAPHPVWSVTLKDNGNKVPSFLSFGRLIHSLEHFTFIQTHSPNLANWRWLINNHWLFFQSIKAQIEQVQCDFAAFKQMPCFPSEARL